MDIDPNKFKSEKKAKVKMKRSKFIPKIKVIYGEDMRICRETESKLSSLRL